MEDEPNPLKWAVIAFSTITANVCFFFMSPAGWFATSSYSLFYLLFTVVSVICTVSIFTEAKPGVKPIIHKTLCILAVAFSISAVAAAAGEMETYKERYPEIRAEAARKSQAKEEKERADAARMSENYNCSITSLALARATTEQVMVLLANMRDNPCIKK